LLFLHGDHAGNDSFAHFQLPDSLETFIDVPLHCLGILGLRQNLKQFFVGQEEKAGEAPPLGLEILGEALLNLVQELVAILKLGLILFAFNVVPHVLFAGKDFQSNLPMLVHRVEFHLLVGHLLLDVLRRKDRLKVHPPSLRLYPVL
jgi:hypothetical protein